MRHKKLKGSRKKAKRKTWWKNGNENPRKLKNSINIKRKVGNRRINKHSH